MTKNKKTEQKKEPTKKFNIDIKGLDIDKNEYQEIILSNSNHPESTYFKRDYYD